MRANRPDCLEHIERVTDPDGPRSDTNQAMLFLLVTGFAAGRQYQIDHPELGVHSFEGEHPALLRPPIKSKDIKR